jgi:hypothetical protein
MQGHPGAARLALHLSSFRGGEAWQAAEGKPSEEEKAIYKSPAGEETTLDRQKRPVIK